MTPLGFWQLLAALVGGIVVLHIVAWWAWRLAASTTVRIWEGSRRLATLRNIANGLGERFPRSAGFIARRFDTTHFTGLPLLLIVLLAGYIIALGAGLLEDLFEGNELQHMDQAINTHLAILRNGRFLELFNWITGLGNTETLVAVTVVAIGFLWAHRRSSYIPGLLVTVAGSQTLTWIGKFAIDRDRPDFVTMASAVSPSFPSAHATGAAAVYGFVAYAVARDLAGERRRFELGFWAVTTIALVAFSRAILSVHFASDIAAGLLVGAFWLLAGFTVTEYLRERARPGSP